MTEQGPGPQIFAARRLIGWHLLQSIDEGQRGDLVYAEAQRLIESVKREIARQIPDHEIDPLSMLLEVGVQYLTPEKVDPTT